MLQGVIIIADGGDYMRKQFNFEQYNDILKQKRNLLIKEKLEQLKVIRIKEEQKKANLDFEKDN